MKQRLIMVYVTFPNDETARQICHNLLEENLIACANIFPPHTSFYKWQGKVNQESEIAALLKTRSELFQKIEQKILSLHPHECPCITKFSAEESHTNFLEWVYDQTMIDKIL